MMTRNILLGLLTMLLVGCTDSVDSLSREYRNTNNEAIDNLMMISSEAQAKSTLDRYFKPLRDRYESIDKRLELLNSNLKKEFVKMTMESDGAHLYLSELQINRQRYALEVTRLRKLLKYTYDKQLELRKNNDPDATPSVQELCPSLDQLVNVEATLQPLRSQLDSPRLLAMMSSFPTMKVDKYEELYEKFLAKRKLYAPPKEFQLVD
jgi:hypothetical protein